MKSRIVFRAALHAGLLIMVFAVALSSPQDGGTYVKGIVIRSNRPVRSVWVIASQGGDEKGRSLTGDDGKYYIGKLSDGIYDIGVVRGKEQIYSGQVTLPTTANYDITIKSRQSPKRRRDP